MTDTMQNEAPEAPETTEADSPDVGRKAAMPTYGLTKVTDLPESYDGGRKNLYFDLLSAVAKDPGEWYEVAHFNTPTGARNALKAITPDADGKTERPVPEGEWEFQVRKVQNEANPVGQKHSKLFARFLG